MKLRRLATACFAALMAVATLATSASAAEGYVEYPGGENPSPKPRVVDYVAGNAEWSHGDGIDITKGKSVICVCQHMVKYRIRQSDLINSRLPNSF